MYITDFPDDSLKLSFSTFMSTRKTKFNISMT